MGGIRPPLCRTRLLEALCLEVGIGKKIETRLGLAKNHFQNNDNIRPESFTCWRTICLSMTEIFLAQRSTSRCSSTISLNRTTGNFAKEFTAGLLFIPWKKWFCWPKLRSSPGSRKPQNLKEKKSWVPCLLFSWRPCSPFLSYCRAIQSLLRSLFKLYDFQNKFLEATQVLLAIDSAEALDYFSAHNLWSIFSLSPEATPSTERSRTDEEFAHLSEKALKVYRLAVGELSLKGLAEKQTFLGELIAVNPDVVLQYLGGGASQALLMTPLPPLITPAQKKDE